MKPPAIAAAKGISIRLARVYLEFALTGKRPVWNKCKRGSGKKKVSHKEIIEEVGRRRDDERQTTKQIADELNVDPATVNRAYDAGHPENVREATNSGRSPYRGSFTTMPKKTLDKIAELAADGERNVRKIASTVGCSDWTVRRELTRLGIKMRTNSKRRS